MDMFAQSIFLTLWNGMGLSSNWSQRWDGKSLKNGGETKEAGLRMNVVQLKTSIDEVYAAD